MHLFFSTPIWINQISNYENINTELQYLDVNPGHHDGVYVMNSLVADLFDDCESNLIQSTSNFPLLA